MKQYKCKACGASWAAKGDHRCLICASTDIYVFYDPDGERKESVSNDDQMAVMLNQQLAVQLNTPRFTELMQLISTYEVQSSNVRVEDAAQYQQATDSLVAVQKVTKELEGMRKEIVAYPNTFTSTVNATFKGLKERCQRARERLEYHAGNWKRKEDARIAQQQAEQAAAQQAEVAQPVEVGDEGAVKPPEPPMPSPTTQATNGQGSVSYRKGKPSVEVVNPAKLIRAAINERNKIPITVINIVMGEVRKAVDEGLYTPKQWEKYGVKVTKGEDQMVVRA